MEVEVIAEANLAIDKRGPLTVTAGSEFAYTVTVWNYGLADAVSTTLTGASPFPSTSRRQASRAPAVRGSPW